MKTFDPNAERKILDGDVGYQFALDRGFERVKSAGGLASSAHAYLNKAVYCLLVDYDGPATQLLKRSFDWLTVAIREREIPRDYGPNETEGERHGDLAMCSWLLHNVHDVENLKLYAEYEDRFLTGSRAGRDRANVSMTLVGYVDAGAYKQALERFAACLSAPKSLGTIRTEGAMSYVLCRHRLGQEYSDADVSSASEKFLRRNMNGWLLDGHALRAAQWMKVLHWREGKESLSPKETIMKCYEYLDGVTPPTYCR